MLLRAAVLVVAAAIAYWPALQAPFLLDDQASVVGNATIRSLTPLSSVLMPPRDTPVAGRPLVNLSFALNYATEALSPRGYRLTNLAIHLAAALLLFAIVRRLLLLPRLRERFASSATDLAFASALLWTLHPLQSEVVNYVTQRTESLMGVFYLLTLYASVRAASGRHRQWTIVAILSCLAGVLSKESIVTVPVAVLLIDRVLVFDSWRAVVAARRGLYAGFAAGWMLLGVLLASGQRTSVGFESGTSAWVYLLNQAQMIVQYLELTFWPGNLVVDYGLPEALAIGDVWPQLLLLGLLFAATVVALIKKPEVGLVGAWFFLTLAPTSSIVPISTEVGAERRMYLPLAALMVLIVIVVWQFLKNDSRPHYKLVMVGRSASVALLVVVSMAMIAGVRLRNRDYVSPLAMARTIVDRWPNGRGHFALGAQLIEAGQREEGMRQFELSVADDFPGALFAIGTEQLAAGQTDEAIDTISRFISAMPNHVNVVPAREMRARAYAATGDLAAAEAEARQLIQLAPRYARGHDLLGRLLAQRGDFSGAASAFQHVLTLQPGDAEARQNLASMQRLMTASW